MAAQPYEKCEPGACIESSGSKDVRERANELTKLNNDAAVDLAGALKCAPWKQKEEQQNGNRR
jgi:hypothetical protein